MLFVVLLHDRKMEKEKVESKMCVCGGLTITPPPPLPLPPPPGRHLLLTAATVAKGYLLSSPLAHLLLLLLFLASFPPAFFPLLPLKRYLLSLFSPRVFFPLPLH